VHLERPDLRVVEAEELERLMLVGEAAIVRFRQQSVLLTAQPVGFGPEGFFEWEVLPSVLDGVLVLRERTLDRISEQRDELRIGHRRVRPLRGGGMEEVVRGCFARRSAPAGELLAVPAFSVAVEEREVVRLLPFGRPDPRVRRQVLVEGCCAGALRADDEEVGESAQRSSVRFASSAERSTESLNIVMSIPDESSAPAT
jgi:hypothetical protein